MNREEIRKAFFVSYPRRLEDIRLPHLLERERPFEIMARVRLSRIDYENFIADMQADREFIENNSAGCEEGAVMRCILVQQKGRNDGVLVVPEHGCFVKMAAYLHNMGDKDA